MRTGPKYKICKRLGAGVFEKCQTQKFALSESREGKKRKGGAPRGLSDYGKQLLEKQKVRYTYGLSEHQLGRYVTGATEMRGVDSGTELMRHLESRLDNVIYRAGLGSTRAMARQIVSHGHVTVNGRRVTIPSFSVSVGDAIAVRAGSKTRTPFITAPERLLEHTTPAWLTFDVKNLEGKVVSSPVVSPTELSFDLGVVLEYYSR
jgi:small subunit ribosomal protein S4